MAMFNSLLLVYQRVSPTKNSSWGMGLVTRNPMVMTGGWLTSLEFPTLENHNGI